MHEIENVVAKFSLKMIETLKRNEHKEGWVDCEQYYLVGKLLEEVKEIVELLMQLHYEMLDKDHIERRVLTSECADVANIVLMIADNWGNLDA